MLILTSWSTSLFACFLFFFNDPATTEIYTLSLHDALPISLNTRCAYFGGRSVVPIEQQKPPFWRYNIAGRDRKSTRLNSSHPSISYAVFCLKKKKQAQT